VAYGGLAVRWNSGATPNRRHNMNEFSFGPEDEEETPEDEKEE
jgi:hypothetical protein